MKNGRKMTEVENLMFTLQMQNATGDADQMKSIVHEELFYNLRTLMEVDGFDMSFMDTQPFIEALCLANKEQIEAGNDVMDWGTRQLAHATFKLYLSRVDDSFVHMVNARDWKHRMHQFVSIYVLCLSEHYADRSGWITIREFFAEKQAAKEGTVRQLIWKKSNPSPMNGQYIYLSGIENAVWFKKKGGTFNARCKNTVFEYPCGRSKMHPTEKNHKLLQELILDNSNPSDLVFDPCAGSGSHLLVARDNGRDYIGIELDEGYFKIAESRLSGAISA